MRPARFARDRRRCKGTGMTLKNRHARALCCAAMPLIACAPGTARAQADEQTLPPVTVSDTPSVAERNKLPLQTESVTAPEIADKVNVMNAEDSIKYLPSILVRKRHPGDTQAPVTTRTSGVGASARSLVYADGVLLS